MFRLFIFVTFIAATSNSLAQSVRWSEGEHLELGTEGLLWACKSLQIPASECPGRKISRNDRKFQYHYGEVLTAADYYNNPKEFFTDRKYMLPRVLKCAYKQKARHASQQYSDVKYPECNSVGLAGLRDYIYVVSHNYNHFGWNNMISYVEIHGRALDFALQAHRLAKTDPVQSKKLLNLALGYNAFADHYLTDAFASGHIRIPRLQIKSWADGKLPGLFGATRGDLLTMYLHDFESLNLRTRKEEGLKVQNSRGDRWETRGDGNLFLLVAPNDPGILLPKLAVAESVREVLLAWKFGETPDGIYAATEYVPFSRDLSLVEKLSPRYQHVKRNQDVAQLILFSVPIFDRLLFSTRDFTKMLDQLSSIFRTFQRDIARAQRDQPELHKRLPARYLQAYLDVD
ncbi:hypothetical protein D3C87_253850 [compost metagenome]